MPEPDVLLALCEQLDGLRAAGSQGHWFFNSYSAISSSERMWIYNEAEGKLADDAPDEDSDALPEAWIAAVPVAAGDTGTRQGQADAALIVAAVNAIPALTAAVRGLLADRDTLARVAALAEDWTCPNAPAAARILALSVLDALGGAA